MPSYFRSLCTLFIFGLCLAWCLLALATYSYAVTPGPSPILSKACPPQYPSCSVTFLPSPSPFSVCPPLLSLCPWSCSPLWSWHPPHRLASVLSASARHFPPCPLVLILFLSRHLPTVRPQFTLHLPTSVSQLTCVLPRFPLQPIITASLHPYARSPVLSRPAQVSPPVCQRHLSHPSSSRHYSPRLCPGIISYTGPPSQARPSAPPLASTLSPVLASTPPLPRFRPQLSTRLLPYCWTSL